MTDNNKPTRDPVQTLQEAELLRLTQEAIDDGWWELLSKILERAEARRMRIEAKARLKEQNDESVSHYRD